VRETTGRAGVPDADLPPLSLRERSAVADDHTGHGLLPATGGDRPADATDADAAVGQLTTMSDRVGTEGDGRGHRRSISAVWVAR
jgi:hypothetical protein